MQLLEMRTWRSQGHQAIIYSHGTEKGYKYLKLTDKKELSAYGYHAAHLAGHFVDKL